MEDKKEHNAYFLERYKMMIACDQAFLHSERNLDYRGILLRDMVGSENFPCSNIWFLMKESSKEALVEVLRRFIAREIGQIIFHGSQGPDSFHETLFHARAENLVSMLRPLVRDIESQNGPIGTVTIQY